MIRAARAQRPGLEPPRAPRNHVTGLGLPFAAAAGFLLWQAMILGQGALASLSPPLGGRAAMALGLAANALIEETLRLGLALGAALWIRRRRLPPETACLAVMASLVVAMLENLGYLARFPTTDVYWRLGYALPVHVNAALLYALATVPAPRRLAADGAAPRGAGARRAALSIAALLVAWGWHTAFNATAALKPFSGLAALGTILNLSLLSTLVVASAIRYGYWSAYAKR